jgi:hypothetical protein
MATSSCGDSAEDKQVRKHPCKQNEKWYQFAIVLHLLCFALLNLGDLKQSKPMHPTRPDHCLYSHKARKCGAK